VAIAVASEAGITLDAGQFEQSLTGDEALAAKVQERVAASHRLMDRLSVSGIPALVMTVNGEDRVLQNSTIYGGGPALIAAIDSALASQSALTN